VDAATDDEALRGRMRAACGRRDRRRGAPRADAGGAWTRDRRRGWRGL
jgi:hypothetical protein